MTVAFSETARSRKIRRPLPMGLKSIEPQRRIFVLRQLLANEGDAGKVAALKAILALPERTWRRLSPAHVADLLDRLPWLDIAPSPVPMVDWFEHKGARYFLPAANFENGTCLEYPLADEYLTAYAADGSESALRRLAATLCREATADTAEALRRGDPRVKLHSRAEGDARADRLAGLPSEWQVVVLLYFAGVKLLVHRLYGAWLFQQPEEDGEEKEAAEQGDGLGWWGLYMDAAGGDVQKLEAIEQSSFHTFCLMEVRRRKQQKQAEMAHKLQSPGFGDSQT